MFGWTPRQELPPSKALEQRSQHAPQASWKEQRVRHAFHFVERISIDAAGRSRSKGSEWQTALLLFESLQELDSDVNRIAWSATVTACETWRQYGGQAFFVLLKPGRLPKGAGCKQVWSLDCALADSSPSSKEFQAV